jgi:hypothetical protein
LVITVLRQSDRENGPKPPTLCRLNAIWDVILADATAQRALRQLAQDGFDIGHLRPRDPAFRTPTWADYIAAIPLVGNRPSRSRFHRSISMQEYLPLVEALRNYARYFDDPFAEKSLISTSATTIPLHEDVRDQAEQTASFIEKFLSWNWSVRERNPRNALIAELRWTIRSRTGKPHDRELSALIDAAYRAAGRDDEPSLDNPTLDRIEKREGETRVKAFRRLKRYSGLRGTPKRKSTRNSHKKR